MNREILFRGKRIDNGEWVYGAFCPDVLEIDGYGKTIAGKPLWLDGFIRLYNPEENQMKMYEVGRETVGQYTGLTDKNGVKIFEGDIVSIPGSKKMGLPAEVYYFPINGSFGLRRHGYSRICLENSDEWALVVGNIHDNPELLEVQNGTTDMETWP